MLFQQIKHGGDNFSYVIADEKSREALVVDPSFNGETIIALLEKERFRATYIVNTHSHSDHTADNQKIRSATGAKIVTHKLARTIRDIAVDDGDILEIGEIGIRVIHTPGHSPDSICLLTDGKLLTGDTLFVGECGTTDLTGGNAEDMYHSLFDKLMKLDDKMKVYPGHDYGSKPHSTIGFERRHNYTLEKRTPKEFIEFMKCP